MEQRSHIFSGRNGKLIVGDKGVTIRRSFAQALTSGNITGRDVTLPYSALDHVKHERSSIRPGYIQLVAKHGMLGVNPMSRHHKIRFSHADEHHFRQAKEMIDARIQELAQASSAAGQPTPPDSPDLGLLPHS